MKREEILFKKIMEHADCGDIRVIRYIDQSARVKRISIECFDCGKEIFDIKNPKYP